MSRLATVFLASSLLLGPSGVAAAQPAKGDQIDARMPAAQVKPRGPADLLAKIFSEVSISANWQDQGRGHRGADTAALGVEIRFQEFHEFETGLGIVDFFLSPRPIVGFTANTADGPDIVYGGLDWTYNFASGFFVGINFSGSVHDGTLHASDARDAGLGSRFLFRSAAEIGTRLKSGHGLSAMIAHASHARMLGGQNQGINWYALRYSYALDSGRRRHRASRK